MRTWALLLILGLCAWAQAEEAAPRAAALWPGMDPFLALAQAPPGATGILPEAFRQAVQQAVQSHPEAAVQRANIAGAEAAVAEAWAAWRPSLGVGSQRREGIANAQRLGFDTGSRTDLYLTGSQLLWDFGSAYATIDARRAGVEAAQAGGGGRLEGLVLAAAQAYSEVAQFRAQVGNANFLRDRMAALRDQLLDRRAMGAGTQADVLRADSRLATLEAARVTLLGQLRQAEAAYEALFNHPPPATLAPLAPVRIAPPGQAEALAQALASNRSLAERAAEARALEREAAAARRSRYPSLTLQLAGRRYDVEGNWLSENSAADEDFAVTVQGAVPVYQGGALGARQDQAEAKARAADFAVAAAKREVVRTVQGRFAEAEARQAELRAQGAVVAADAAAVAALSDQFLAGRSSLTELLDAQRDLFFSTRALLSAQSLALQAELAYAQATGTLLDTFGLSLRP